MWETRSWFFAKVRPFSLNEWLIKRGFESSSSSFHFVLAGGEGEITWQKDDEDIDDEEKVIKVDETSSKLVIKKATMADAGIYTCHCDFDNGHVDQTTMQLYVFGMWPHNSELQFVALQLGKASWASSLSSDGLSFGETKIYHEFLEGTEGVVPCLVTGQPAVNVVWLRDKKQISSEGRTSVIKMPHARSGTIS